MNTRERLSYGYSFSLVVLFDFGFCGFFNSQWYFGFIPMINNLIDELVVWLTIQVFGKTQQLQFVLFPRPQYLSYLHQSQFMQIMFNARTVQQGSHTSGWRHSRVLGPVVVAISYRPHNQGGARYPCMHHNQSRNNDRRAQPSNWLLYNRNTLNSCSVTLFHLAPGITLCCKPYLIWYFRV